MYTVKVKNKLDLDQIIDLQQPILYIAKIPISSHANTCITGDGLLKWEENDGPVCRRQEMGFKFWLEESEDECLTLGERQMYISHSWSVISLCSLKKTLSYDGTW